MLKKMFTNQINYSIAEYFYIRSNTFNIFVKNKDDKQLMNDLYSSTFQFLPKLMIFEDIINSLNIKRKQLKEEELKYNNILSRNKKELVKQLDVAIFEKYEKELLIQEEEIKTVENTILIEEDKLRILNDYHSLNFDTFIYFLKNNYDKKVEKDFIYMLKNINKQDKIMFNIIYYLVKYNLIKILKDVINHYNLNKNEVSVIIESENLELILLLIEKHSNKIVKFDIIYNIFLFNREKVSKLNINSTNAYIKYIHSHIIINRSL
jgi:hypothetical protein